MSLTGKIMNFFADKDMTIPAFPRTKVKAVSDDNGVGLNAIIDDINNKIGSDSVAEQIARAVPSSLPADGGNADTVDGMHASEFAVASDVIDLQTKVGDTPVATQISNALADFPSGKTLSEHLTEENMVLSSLQYGPTLPSPGTPGRIFFLKVSE